MARTGLFEFSREVRREMAKVTWPSRKEATSATIGVLAMVALASIFFLIVDEIVAFAIKIILGVGG